MRAAMQQQEPDRSEPRTYPASTPELRRAAAASHLAHDARNWLTVLQIYCDLLRGSDAVAGNGRTWIEELSNAVARGQSLVTSLLDSAQTCAAVEPASAETAGSKTLDLAAILQSREPLFRQMAGSAIQVELKTAAHSETTALQETELDRILLNLVRNGIDAMPRGGRLKIELRQGDASRRNPLELRVSDTGSGIPPQILAHIFESGFSTKATTGNSKSERGFGLAIVRELTLAAGGSVRIRSRIGQGTRVTLELPVLSAETTTRSQYPQSKTVAAVAEMPKIKPSRTASSNNFDEHRKGTRVPC